MFVNFFIRKILLKRGLVYIFTLYYLKYYYIKRKSLHLTTVWHFYTEKYELNIFSHAVFQKFDLKRHCFSLQIFWGSHSISVSCFNFRRIINASEKNNFSLHKKCYPLTMQNNATQEGYLQLFMFSF